MTRRARSSPRILDWVGDQPFRVGPGALLFGVFAPGAFVRASTRVGTTEGSSSCAVASIQFLAE